MILIGVAPLTTADILAVARDGVPVALAPDAVRRIEASHAALCRLIAMGAPIYGVSTGLGAAVDTPVRAEGPAQQRGIPLARAVAVGQRAERGDVRAMILARVARIACGASGASLEITQALLAMLERGVTPIVPLTGSLGEADLAPLAHIAAVLAGEGEAERDGTMRPAAAALAEAGIALPAWGPKDGLALVSSSAATVGMAALAVCDAERAFEAALAAAALSLEGFRGSLAPFDPRAALLRPAPGQAATAARLLTLLDGGDLARTSAARRLQDPLSFRVLASVHGAAAQALQTARDMVELELNSSDDNPAILPDSPAALPTANFDPTALALAFESLGQALLRVAAAAAGRLLRLMSPAVNDLPRFLAAPGQNGFATVQKTVAALLAEMQHVAAPMPVVVLPVADSVEDYATMALSIVVKTAVLVAKLRLITAAELMVAAQACDLRTGDPHAPVRLGAGTGAIHAAVRAAIPPLDQDRRPGPDIEALAAMVRDGAFA
ncbi:MAG: histidine ammonia-lyase [Acetobacteraceae bacterium]